MKPDLSVMPEREAVVPEKRRPLTRREVIELSVQQLGRCGCGCGEKLDALREGVIDEHRVALTLGGSNDLSNRELWRKPCATAKTARQDAPAIAKAKRIRDREENGPSAPKLKSNTKLQGRGFDRRFRRKFNGTVEARKP